MCLRHTQLAIVNSYLLTMPPTDGTCWSIDNKNMVGVIIGVIINKQAPEVGGCPAHLLRSNWSSRQSNWSPLK